MKKVGGGGGLPGYALGELVHWSNLLDWAKDRRPVPQHLF